MSNITGGRQLLWDYRFLSPTDLNEVKQLCTVWFPVRYPEKWFIDITSGQRFYSLAAVDPMTGCIIGFIVCDIKTLSQVNQEDSHLLATSLCSDETRVAYILSLGVTESYRRKSLGSALLNKLLEYLSSSVMYQVKAVYLHVLSTNFAAIRFYEKHNFVQHVFLPYYYHIAGQCKDGCTYVLYINGGRGEYSTIGLRMLDKATAMPGSNTIKILVTGAATVGKTTLIRKVLNLDLIDEYEATDDDWYTDYLYSQDGEAQKVQFLDTGDYDHYVELVKCYVRMAKVCIVVMEYGDTQSFLCAQKIVNDINRLRDDLPTLCVSTKCDTEVYRAGQIFDCGGTDHVICSSRLNIGIAEIKAFLRRHVFLNRELEKRKAGRKAIKEKILFLPTDRKHTTYQPAQQRRSGYESARSASPVGSPLSSRRNLWIASSFNRSCSQPDISLKVPKTSPHGSYLNLGRLSLSSSATTEKLNEIYKKYGYEKKPSPTSSLGSSFGNLTSGIRHSTNSIVNTVHDTLAKFAL